jgi:hypothetical protein
MGINACFRIAFSLYFVPRHMKRQSTQPIEVEGTNNGNRPWQHNELTWSFGPARERIVGWPDESQIIPTLANQDSMSTEGPQQIRPPKKQAILLEGHSYGQRSLQALFEWEGVVESVDRTGFHCRLVPLKHGSADRSTVELTDFSFDDLATESDRSLVVAGAIFYWTVGRSRNAAGTVTNLSLVRFRRLPAPTKTQMVQAEREAEELLRVLGNGNGSQSASG